MLITVRAKMICAVVRWSVRKWGFNSVKTVAPPSPPANSSNSTVAQSRVLVVLKVGLMNVANIAVPNTNTPAMLASSLWKYSTRL